jgi:hypothetical protein
MTTQFQQVEPLNDLHHDKIIAAFNELFITGGGQSDGNGDGTGDGGGYGWGNGNGYGDGTGGGYGNGWGYGNGKCPEEWLVGP